MTKKQIQRKVFNKFNSITQRDKQIIDLTMELMQEEIHNQKRKNMILRDDCHKLSKENENLKSSINSVDSYLDIMIKRDK